MPFGRLSDEFFSNRKVLKCIAMPHGMAAIGLWTVAGSWCNSELTDGFVPFYAIAAYPHSKKLAAILVDAELWSKVEDGYQFHDWEDFNDLKKDVLEKRAKEAAKKGNQRATDRASKALSRVPSNEVSPKVSPGDNPRDDNKTPIGYPDPPSPDQDQDQKSPLPPLGDRPMVSASAGQEVRDGWAAAWFAANAGTPPVLTGQNFAAAVEFARQVAKTHGRPLGEAARAIAAHVIAHGKRGREDVFDLARVDPYAAPQSAPGAPGESWEAYQARRKNDPWAGIKQ